MYMANATMTRITPARANRRLGECERMTRLGPSGLRMNSGARQPMVAGAERCGLRAVFAVSAHHSGEGGGARGKREGAQLGRRAQETQPFKENALGDGPPVFTP